MGHLLAGPPLTGGSEGETTCSVPSPPGLFPGASEQQPQEYRRLSAAGAAGLCGTLSLPGREAAEGLLLTEDRRPVTTQFKPQQL